MAVVPDPENVNKLLRERVPIPSDLSDSTRFDSTQFDAIRFDAARCASNTFYSIRSNSIRVNPFRFNSIRFHSTRFDSIRSKSIVSQFKPVRYATHLPAAEPNPPIGPPKHSPKVAKQTHKANPTYHHTPHQQPPALPLTPPSGLQHPVQPPPPCHNAFERSQINFYPRLAPPFEARTKTCLADTEETPFTYRAAKRRRRADKSPRRKTKKNTPRTFTTPPPLPREITKVSLNTSRNHGPHGQTAKLRS